MKQKHIHQSAPETERSFREPKIRKKLIKPPVVTSQLVKLLDGIKRTKKKKKKAIGSRTEVGTGRRMGKSNGRAQNDGRRGGGNIPGGGKKQTFVVFNLVMLYTPLGGRVQKYQIYFFFFFLFLPFSFFFSRGGKN